MLIMCMNIVYRQKPQNCMFGTATAEGKNICNKDNDGDNYENCTRVDLLNQW